MSSAVLEAPATLFAAATAAAPANAPRAHRPSGRSRTLAELLDDTLRAARSAAPADCPMCHEPMQLDGGAAHCGSCGTTLS
jgi:hypothetical protein